MDSTPASVLEQLRGPDRGPAWVRFVRLYTPLLAYWANRAGVPDADRADLIQDVFVVLVRVVPTFHYEPGRSFRVWLHTVLVNKWKDHCRKKSVPLLTEMPEPAVEDGVPLIDEAEYRAVLAARRRIGTNCVLGSFSDRSRIPRTSRDAGSYSEGIREIPWC